MCGNGDEMMMVVVTVMVREEECGDIKDRKE